MPAPYRGAIMQRSFLGGVLLTIVSAVAAGGEDEKRILKHIDKLGGKHSANSYAPSTSVNAVDLGGTHAVDGDLEVVTSLPELRFLFVRSTRITDAGLKYVA